MAAQGGLHKTIIMVCIHGGECMAFRLLGEHDGRRLRLLVFPGDHVLGFSRDADLQVMLPSVSRRHARLRVEGDRLMVEDLGSSKGTRVSGQPLHGIREVQPGDRLEFGAVVFQVEAVRSEAHDPDLTLTPLTGDADTQNMLGPAPSPPGSLDGFTLESLPGLLRTAAAGIDRAELARRLGESLYRSLPVRGVKITSHDGMVVVFQGGEVCGTQALIGAVEGLRLAIDFADDRPQGHERLFELAGAVLGLAPDRAADG